VALQQIHSPVEDRRRFWQRYLGQISIRQNAEQQLANGNVKVKAKASFGTIQQFYRPGLVPNMASIELAAKRRGLSIQSIILALYARVHARVFAGEDSTPLVVGLYLANRSHVMDGLSELMAPTLNIVPLILETDGKDSLFVAARKIQDDINEISRVEYVGVSLFEIAEWTGVCVDVCVNFLRLPESEEEPVNHGVNGVQVQFKSIQREDLANENISAHTHAQTNGFQKTKSNGDTTGSIPNQTIPAPATIEDIFMVSGSARSIDRQAKRALMQFLRILQPTIDVEAAVRDGKLDFGLFAPSTRLDGVDAERAIEGVREEMGFLMEE
jgi:hypothetical protein